MPSAMSRARATCNSGNNSVTFVPGLAVRDRDSPRCVRFAYGHRPPAAGLVVLAGGRRHAAAPVGRDEPALAPPQGEEHGHQVIHAKIL